MINCKKCNEELLDNWTSCPNCGAFVTIGEYINCTRCYQLFQYSKKANFCPFCRYQLVKKIKVKGVETININNAVVTRFEDPERYEIEEDTSKITKERLKIMYRFDFGEMMKIAGNKRLNIYSLPLIFMIALSAAGSLILIDSIFTAGSLTKGTRTFVIASFSIPAILYMVAIALKEIVKMMGLDIKTREITNIIAATSPVFISLHIISIFLAIYVRMFMRSNSEIALLIYFTLNGIGILFLTIQLLLFVKNIVGSSGFMSFILLMSSYWVAGIVGGMYVNVLLNRLMDVIL